MLVIRRFLLVLIIFITPVIMRADGMKGLEAAFEIYATFCLFMALIGMLVLMFAPKQKWVSAVCAIVNILVGLPVLFLLTDWGFEQQFTGPVLSFLIGIIIVIRMIGAAPKDPPAAAS